MSVTPTNDLSEVKLEDDEPNIARPKRATSAHLQPNRRDLNTREYTIVNSLRTPRSTSHAVAALYDQIMDRSINLDPDDQRDAVWSNEKRIGLIDSVFRNYYIPPIIFAFSTTDDGSEIRNCIDGKQRLRSIQMFMNGEIPHRDHLTAECYWYKKSELHAGPLLSKRLQRYFQYKLIQCVEYDNLNEEQEREIFQRVEHGLALTPAESLQGLSGPWPDFLREIKSKVIGDRRFGDSFDWGRTPWRDFNMLASIVYLVEELPVRKPPPTYQTLETWLKRTTDIPLPELRTGVRDTFRVYLSLAGDAIYKKPFKRSVSPIEFIMIGVMVYMKQDTLSPTKLSHAVKIMRATVPSKKKDVSDERVSKLLFELIDEMPLHNLRSDKRGDKSAQSTLPPFSPTPTSTRPPEPESNKRKLEVNDERIDQPLAKIPRLWGTVPPEPLSPIYESRASVPSRIMGPQPSPFEDQSNDIEPSLLPRQSTPRGDDDYDRRRGYDQSQPRYRSAPPMDRRRDHSIHPRSPRNDVDGISGVRHNGPVAGGPGGVLVDQRQYLLQVLKSWDLPVNFSRLS